ncbi:MAG: DUF1800 domain-containing protein [Variovorax sp.]|nr:DUF1800 domain-containing protein [Variovorax sp.]
MPFETTTDLEAPIASPPPAPAPLRSTAILAALGLAASLEACGGGGGSDSPAPSPASTLAPPPVAPTAVEASRFLAQASLGASRAQIASVQTLGYSGWIDAQFALPASTTRWDFLVAAGLTDVANKNSEAGFDSAAWAKLLGAPDTLRQRITLAYSEIFVAAIDGLVGGGWRQFSAATYLDLLEANAFGNHRTLLQQISLSAPMGQFLTFRGSAKGNTTTGALPDENYARELMQLFTLGLVQLNLDGTPTLTNGSTTYTYGLADVTGLARVFTGWDFDLGGQSAATATATPDFIRKPMVQVTSRYETGAKTFLGTTIAAGVDAPSALTQALDAIFAHVNVAPFFSRQLIQRLVTSNPSAAYVARVATVFNNNGSGAKGDLKAVIKAVLLDDEARSASAAAASSFGKLREPIVRFTGWARAYGAASASNAWAIGNTSNPATRLAQSPLRSPSVFNFFRPGYVPPNTGFDATAMVAPEFQIANESSVVGYLNFLQRAVSGQGVGDVLADYTTLLAIADDAGALFAEINLVLASGRLSANTLTPLVTAVASMASGTDAARKNRIYAALVLVLAAPEFLIQK